MFLKRSLSLLIDIFVILVPAVIAYYKGMSLPVAFFLFSIVGLPLQTISSRGRTFGMLVCRIAPLLSPKKEAGVLRMIVYHVLFSLLLFNAFQYSAAAIGAALVLVPWYKSTSGAVSAIDLLHKLYWANVENIAGLKPN